MEYDSYCTFDFVENVNPIILPNQHCIPSILTQNTTETSSISTITCAPTSHDHDHQTLQTLQIQQSRKQTNETVAAGYLAELKLYEETYVDCSSLNCFDCVDMITIIVSEDKDNVMFVQFGTENVTSSRPSCRSVCVEEYINQPIENNRISLVLNNTNGFNVIGIEAIAQNGWIFIAVNVWDYETIDDGCQLRYYVTKGRLLSAPISKL